LQHWHLNFQMIAGIGQPPTISGHRHPFRLETREDRIPE
jgi:hypothetical protein